MHQDLVAHGQAGIQQPPLVGRTLCWYVGMGSFGWTWRHASVDPRMGVSNADNQADTLACLVLLPLLMWHRVCPGPHVSTLLAGPPSKRLPSSYAPPSWSILTNSRLCSGPWRSHKRRHPGPGPDPCEGQRLEVCSWAWEPGHSAIRTATLSGLWGGGTCVTSKSRAGSPPLSCRLHIPVGSGHERHLSICTPHQGWGSGSGTGWCGTRSSVPAQAPLPSSGPGAQVPAAQCVGGPGGSRMAPD